MCSYIWLKLVYVYLFVTKVTSQNDWRVCSRVGVWLDVPSFCGDRRSSRTKNGIGPPFMRAGITWQNLCRLLQQSNLCGFWSNHHHDVIFQTKHLFPLPCGSILLASFPSSSCSGTSDRFLFAVPELSFLRQSLSSPGFLLNVFA